MMTCVTVAGEQHVHIIIHGCMCRMIKAFVSMCAFDTHLRNALVKNSLPDRASLFT